MTRIAIFILLVLSLSCGRREDNSRTIFIPKPVDPDIPRKTVEANTDPVTGIKTVEEIIASGTGGGITGTGPSKVEHIITKYDGNNTLIYSGRKVSVASGCMVTTADWRITIYNPDKTCRKLRILDASTVRVDSINKNNKLISRKNYTIDSFDLKEWDGYY